MSKKSSDIRDAARATLIQAISDIRTKYRNTKFVLIIDDDVTTISTALTDMSELMENSVVLIERLSLKRRPLPTYHAIYLLGPSVDINLFIADWEKEPKYAAPHLLFTYAANATVLQKLQANAAVVDRIQTCRFLYVHFIPKDPLTFSVNCKSSFNSMYSPGPEVPLEKTQKRTVQGLVSFFFSLKAKPAVAYDKKFSPCTEFAEHFISEMDKTVKSASQDTQQSFSNSNTLLIVIPRGSDPVAPLLHQFTFEAMVYEHYNVVDEIYTIDKENAHSFLSMNYYYDETVRDLRYIHMESLIDNVRSMAQPFLNLRQQQTQGSAKEKTEANRKISKVRKQYDQVISAFNVSLEIVEKKITAPVMDAANYEQTMASGYKNIDTKFKPSKVELSQYLSRSDLKEPDKVRLLALFGMSGKKMPLNEVQRSMQSAGIDQKYRNTALNASLVSNEVERKSKYNKDAYTTSKYIPYVVEVVQGAIDKKLPKKDFEVPEDSGKYQNIVLFMMGGISYMELRELNDLRNKMRGVKLYVGSTDFITPNAYLDQIGALKNNPTQ